MPGDQTVGDLYKAEAIVEADLDAAVEAYMSDPTISQFAIGAGYKLDLHAAVEASPFARVTMARDDASAHVKRTFVRLAILLARPVKG
ncbi:MAG: hypothetical protein K2Y56_24520 [Methylobacterium sp.]|uniref:hypothetical protein n=1 Tax=Methylobacterium sp. TaxID=409 RepID=UPI0025D20D84|nr:hypothetical protein [Methylobacterium sp.]MBX9934638.1 hypothetical protein [Methylobacterium sp.]